jgi:hypothetical protein
MTTEFLLPAPKSETLPGDVRALNEQTNPGEKA